MPGKSIIKTENLSVLYDEGTEAEYQALRDINIELYDGEYIIFFGPSGSGKSTLLYSLAGLERRTTGKIVVDGIEITSMTDHELEQFHREEVGMVFQAYYLIPSVSILDNVALPQIFSNADLQERRDKAFKLLEKFSVGQLSDRVSSELSGGQQQRVAIARALVNDPKILIADEPVGNLDSKSRKQVMDVFHKLNNEDKQTIVMVTHEPEHLTYADRIFYMKDGEIVKVVENKNKRAPGELSESTSDDFAQRQQQYAITSGAGAASGGIQAGTGSVVTEGSGLASIGTQDGTNFRGELQAMLGRMPKLPEEQLKARLLMDYLLTTLRESELTRIENLLTKRIRGDIDEKQLVEEFDKSFKEGGVGLNFTTAKHFTNTVSELMHQAEVLSRPYTTELQALYLSHLLKSKRVGYDYSTLSDDQKESLREALKARLEDKIGPDNFYLLLERQEKDGGVGLSGARARAYVHLVEVLLAERTKALKKKVEEKLKEDTTKEQLLLPAPKKHKATTLGNVAISSISSLLIDSFGDDFSEAGYTKLAHLLKLHFRDGTDKHVIQKQMVDEVGLSYERVTQLFNQVEEIVYLSFMTKLSMLIQDYFALAGEETVNLVTEHVRQWLRTETDKQTFINELHEQMEAPSEHTESFFDHLKQLRHGMGIVV